jgi:hypothetical protein
MRVTSVELVWSMAPPPKPVPPPFPRARLGVMATPLPPLPSMQELADVSRAVASQPTFDEAAYRLEHEARRLTRSNEALCVVFDWARRRAWSGGAEVANPSVIDLVADVAGSGKWSMIGNALVVPIGSAPARAVLALRRTQTYQGHEAGMVSALCGGIAPAIERLLATWRP